MTTCYIGLGSNLGQPRQQLDHAVTALKQLEHTLVIACSALYSSKPMGPQDQPDYVNAVIGLETELAPHYLLKALQKIELTQGRVRKAQRWGPRTLDLDILLYGNQIIDSPDLTVPHYGLRQREFVLYPLADIAPDLILPDGTSLQDCLVACDRNGLQQL